MIEKRQNTDELLAERGRTHGEYSEHARCTQSIMRALEAERGWDELPDIVRETCHMIAHKLGRVVTGHALVPDHWDDIGGYARLVSQRIASEATTKPGALADGHRPQDLWHRPLVPCGAVTDPVDLSRRDDAGRCQDTSEPPVPAAVSDASSDASSDHRRDRRVPRYDVEPGTPGDGGHHDAEVPEDPFVVGARVVYLGRIRSWAGLSGEVVRRGLGANDQLATVGVRFDTKKYASDSYHSLFPHELAPEAAMSADRDKSA